MYISATASITARDLSAAALQRLRIERRAVMAGGLGNVDRDSACRRVDALGLVAVGIALALGRALVGAGAQEPLPLDLHGKLERTPKTVAMSPGPCSIRCSRRASTAVSLRPSIRASPWLVRNSMEYQDGPRSLPGHAPAGSAKRPRKPNFQTSGYSTLRADLDKLAWWARVPTPVWSCAQFGGYNSASGYSPPKDKNRCPNPWPLQVIL